MEQRTKADAQVIVEKRGAAGIIRLNRPKAINSLTLPMVRDLFQALQRFEEDADISCVVLTGEGDRGLCAGGDVRIIHDLGKAGDPQVLDFWREEFPLNYRIARFGKPYIALMDGIVMGGGVGISAHGSHRIVTERTKLAMPETGIGYFPDVGGSWLLPRAPGECGTWLGLTGNVVTAADAIYAGFADYLVPSDRLDGLIQDLSQAADTDSIETAIAVRAVEAGEGVLSINRDIIDATFRFDTVEEIFEALSARQDAFSRETLEVLQKRSPTSLKLTLKLLRLGRESASLIECLEREFAAGTEILRQHDFYEGVRAALVDKDRNPRWQPARLEEVREEDIAPYFAAHSGNLFPDHRL
ncbi:enoyl-CoA hydratase/isomerase family protein [Agrobacterium tumefaciens]|uniref:enoyl-CoA hydratase/isomerase family protein n=1 Tax=Agrobacterium tumefaciens TaxID=358 RepID=UPI00080FCC54|nr:enoyl-CoA hydratase/isomerase family protein [Agrobacterium tumefaciens]NSZ03412.1 enoyl-CoA hydratase/isomerase family protein [Agrobacterium tumefaciens]NSZ37660.1 enoyl-CoA hydratase/isomerase family protein [Agrobacterium tumefaciens]NTB03984.1 enoyl-CoA hydratase/isomerase family protein [Agrobacterium tumefaciens]NTB23914.1 enoyl-CoA hydratase/isomerase family protein [Agrobacterium tumefaciens]NTB31453.1 enoyl-CoA hydratase/isomerase family protein [Agrobacterium tumefaciens]